MSHIYINDLAFNCIATDCIYLNHLPFACRILCHIISLLHFLDIKVRTLPCLYAQYVILILFFDYFVDLI